MIAIELTSPRIVTIEDRGRQFSLKLARITKKQWVSYFEGIYSSSENQGGKRVDRFDSSSARVELVESALIDATGYATADNSPVTEIKGWQAQIPLSHRLAAGEALVNVERADAPEGDSILLGAEAVYLAAVWSADDKGVMQKYRGLCHRFKTPTAEQQRRLSRESSRSQVIGGSRKGTTVWMGSQGILAALYDELVVSVEGYAVKGDDLGSNRDAIVAEMDTFHKVAAADILFAPISPNVSEEQ
jgi:hypothetical protein